MLVTANVIHSSLILPTLKREATYSFETSVLTRATRRHISEDGILHECSDFIIGNWSCDNVDNYYIAKRGSVVWWEDSSGLLEEYRNEAIFLRWTRFWDWDKFSYSNSVREEKQFPFDGYKILTASIMRHLVCWVAMKFLGSGQSFRKMYCLDLHGRRLSQIRNRQTRRSFLWNFGHYPKVHDVIVQQIEHFTDSRYPRPFKFDHSPVQERRNRNNIPKWKTILRKTLKYAMPFKASTMPTFCHFNGI
jgi:hypothetical protein